MGIWEKFAVAAAVALSFARGLSAGEAKEIPSSQIVIRDPFVFADEASGKYYMPASDSQSLKMYVGENLKDWRDLGACFVPDKNFWGKRDFWAPDMFRIGGKYYIVATFSCDDAIGTNKYSNKGKSLLLRGCAALVSDRPEGPYKPVSAAEPLTPKNWMCLDGTIFGDGGNLWLIYCHEWVQSGDGEIVAQRVSNDLSKTIGEPIILFRASEAKWSRSMRKGENVRVTDAGVINRMPDGRLLMTWSSSGKNGYCIGAAVSESGKVEGPWRQLDEPLNSDDGGHAMIFKTFGGELKISYHAPNRYPERLQIKDFSWDGGNPKIGR